MKFSNTVIITLLAIGVPLVFAQRDLSVDFFSKCGGSRVLISDYELANINIDGISWFGSDLTCQVIFQSLSGISDPLYFEVTSYSNPDHVQFKVEGSFSSPGIFATWHSIGSSLYMYDGYSRRSIYQYIRITVTRRRSSSNDVNVQMTMNTSDYYRRYGRLQIGVILGIVAGVLCAIGLAIAVVLYYCCCRHRMGRPGVVMATTATQPGQPQGYPMTLMQTTTVQGGAYPAQYGYSSVNQPMNPGYPNHPGGIQVHPSGEMLPPPYPGNVDTK